MKKTVYSVFTGILMLTVCCSYADEVSGKPDVAILETETIAMLDAGEFVKLDKRLSRYDRTLERTKSGLTKINAVFFPLAKALLAKPYTKEILHKWKKEVPDSWFPDLINARRLSSAAWKERGTGLSNTVSGRKWATAQAYADEAIRKLDSIKFPGDIKSPIYYNIKLSAVVLSSSPDKKADLLRIFNESIHQYPTYYFSYFIMLDLLQPKWFGEPGEWLRFVEEQVDAAKEDYADVLYTRLIWSMVDSDLDGDTSHRRMLAIDFFYKYPEIDWPRMRKGFKDIIVSYPSPWNLNTFAWFACVAGDKKTARSLQSRVEKHPIHKLWGGEDGYISWTAWAKQPEFPIPDKLKARWRPRKGDNISLLFSPFDKELRGLVAVEMGDFHFEGHIKGFRLAGPGYERTASHEARGTYSGAIRDVRKVLEGPCWRKEQIGVDNESIYRGGFAKGLKEWTGLEQLKHGPSYLGKYRNGKRNGLGRLIKPRAGYRGMAEIYYGEFKNDVYDGFGMLAGSKVFYGYTFIGTFSKGKPIGIGALVNLPFRNLSDITIRNIKFLEYKENGSFSPVGRDPESRFDFIHYTKNGRLYSYIGFVENDLPMGMGLQLNNQGRQQIIIANWVMGGSSAVGDYIRYSSFSEWYYSARGGSILYRNDVIYRGDWDMDIFSLTTGSIIYPDGRIVEWKSNKPEPPPIQIRISGSGKGRFAEQTWGSDHVGAYVAVVTPASAAPS